MTQEAQEFDGYDEMRYTPVPDEFFDWQMQDLAGAEIKVMLYIFRRTFGFKKHQDRIALSQFADGISKQTGEKLDAGCGLKIGTVSKTIKKLVELGYIDCQFYCRCGRMVEPDELTQEIRMPLNRKPYSVTLVPRECPGCGQKLQGREQRWFSLVMKKEGGISPRKRGYFPQEKTRNSIKIQKHLSMVLVHH